MTRKTPRRNAHLPENTTMKTLFIHSSDASAVIMHVAGRSCRLVAVARGVSRVPVG